MVGKPRRKAKPHRLLDTIFVTGSSVIIVVLAAGLASTIFSWWTPSDFLPQAAREDLSVAQAISRATAVPTQLPTEKWDLRIGIVSGHRDHDSGAVCEDASELTEAAVNYAVAELVVTSLRGMGYDVDLLSEYDERLSGYQANALVSIHADSCDYINDLATGFKVAAAAGRMTALPQDQHLVQCLTEHYGAVTGLPVHASITEDMTYYHSFGEVSPHTPAAIIEVGFLYLDRELLTQHPDVVAKGIVDGLLCYLETPVATPTSQFIEPAASPSPAPTGVVPDMP